MIFEPVEPRSWHEWAPFATWFEHRRGGRLAIGGRLATSSLPVSIRISVRDGKGTMQAATTADS